MYGGSTADFCESATFFRAPATLIEDLPGGSGEAVPESRQK